MYASAASVAIFCLKGIPSEVFNISTNISCQCQNYRRVGGGGGGGVWAGRHTPCADTRLQADIPLPQAIHWYTLVYNPKEHEMTIEVEACLFQRELTEVIQVHWSVS